MSHPKMEELIAGYVTHSLEDGDTRSACVDILDHVPTCETCRMLYVDMRDVAGDLALAAPPLEVPRALEDRILRSINGEMRAPATTHKRRPRSVRAALVAATISALSLAGLSASFYTDLRQERGRTQLMEQALAYVGDPRSDQATLSPSTGVRGSAALALTSDGRGVLIGLDLADVPEGKVLQLWVMQDASAPPLSGGVFRPSDDVTVVDVAVPRGDYVAAAITVEDGPRGAPQPTSDMIYAGKLTV